MAGRNRHPMHGGLHGFRDGPPPPMHRGPGPIPLHHMEEELSVRDMEIRRLHAEKMHLIEENVARNKDITAMKDEIHALGQAIPKIRADKEAGARELIQRGLKLEAELRGLEPLKAEAMKLKSEAQKLDAQCQELNTNSQAISQDLKRLQAENQQIPAMKNEVEGLHEELRHARNAIEYEKKAHVELLEQRQAMESNLIAMAREIEKLRAELKSMDKRAGGPGAGTYGGLKAAPGMGYPPLSYGDGGGYGSEKGFYGSGSSYELRGIPRH